MGGGGGCGGRKLDGGLVMEVATTMNIKFAIVILEVDFVIVLACVAYRNFNISVNSKATILRHKY